MSIISGTAILHIIIITKWKCRRTIKIRVKTIIIAKNKFKLSSLLGNSNSPIVYRRSVTGILTQKILVRDQNFQSMNLKKWSPSENFGPGWAELF